MNEADQQALLDVAECCLRAVAMGRDPTPPAGAWAGEVDHHGAFVTLRVRGALRGCVGTFFPREPLPHTVHRMTREALNDPRFEDQRIAFAELADVHIEISVLSPLRRTSDPESLRPGIDGVFIRYLGRTGCFLPQVAVDAGWTARELLEKCCTTKMHAAPDAWRAPDAQVNLFTTECFARRVSTAS